MDNMKLKALPKQKELSDMAYESIKEYLLASKLEPGFKMTESVVARELGISTTPLRIAFKRLEMEGLVRIVPRRYIEVVGFSAGDVKEVFELREYLEALAVRLVCARAGDKDLHRLEDILHEAAKKLMQEPLAYDSLDNQFHAMLIDLSGNSRLKSVFDSMQTQIRAIRVRMCILSQWPKKAHEEHLTLLGFLQERNAERAEECIKLHIRRVKEAYIVQLMEREKKIAAGSAEDA